MSRATKINDLVRYKKRAEQINERPAYDVFDKTSGTNLGYVGYLQDSYGGGEQWLAHGPDGKSVFRDHTDTHYQRSGAATALRGHWLRQQARAERDAQLAQIGVEIDSESRYTHKGVVMFELVVKRNTSSPGTQLYDFRWRSNSGPWGGTTSNGHRIKPSFDTERELLEAAIPLLSEDPVDLGAINKTLPKGWEVSTYVEAEKGRVFRALDSEFPSLELAIGHLQKESREVYHGVNLAAEAAGGVA